MPLEYGQRNFLMVRQDQIGGSILASWRRYNLGYTRGPGLKGLLNAATSD